MFFWYLLIICVSKVSLAENRCIEVIKYNDIRNPRVN